MYIIGCNIFHKQANLCATECIVMNTLLSKENITGKNRVYISVKVKTNSLALSINYKMSQKIKVFKI